MEGPLDRGKEADLVGFINIGVHTVLDHLLHQQGVGLIADLTKPRERGESGAAETV